MYSPRILSAFFSSEITAHNWTDRSRFATVSDFLLFVFFSLIFIIWSFDRSKIAAAWTLRLITDRSAPQIRLVVVAAGACLIWAAAWNHISPQSIIHSIWRSMLCLPASPDDRVPIWAPTLDRMCAASVPPPSGCVLMIANVVILAEWAEWGAEL